MAPRLILILLGWLGVSTASADPPAIEFDQPPHDYWTRPLKDRFTQLTNDFAAGRIKLDYTTEQTFLASLLKALDIPASSQSLVFSTTSLQLSLISPRNPRALYFNEDVYLGYIPGGKIEIISLDPELGGIFYIFNIPRTPQPLNIERATRCMNCHSGEETRYVPGINLKSVIPGQRGGSLKAYRINETGHQIPFSERFGGWYVTGNHGITNHWGNVIGQTAPGQPLAKIPVEPGRTFSYDRYPVPGSDILPQLILEHQAGFVNRAVEAAYRTRSYLHLDQGKLTAEHARELDQTARELTRYLLFADEAPLPPGGVEGDANFKTDFLRNRKGAGGRSLKDFDLKTRLFKHRCSYMIYSPTFQGLPAEMKQRVYRQLGEALGSGKPHPDFAHLPAEERQVIRAILKATVSDLARNW